MFPDSGLSISLLILQHHILDHMYNPVYSCIYVRISPKCLSPSSLCFIIIFITFWFFTLQIGTKTSFCITHPPTLIPYHFPFLHLNSLYRPLPHLLHFLSICHFKSWLSWSTNTLLTRDILTHLLLPKHYWPEIYQYIFIQRIQLTWLCIVFRALT